MDGYDRQAAGSDPAGTADPLIGSLSDIVDLLAGGAPADEALLRIAQAAESVAAGTSCAILRVDDDGKRLFPGAAPRLPVALVQRIQSLGVGPNRGLCGSAAFNRAPILIPDIIAASPDAELAAVVRATGIGGGWACPLINREGMLLGTFSIYFPAGAMPDGVHAETYGSLLRSAIVVLEHDRRGRAALDANRRLASLALNVPGVLYQRRVGPGGEIGYTFISESVKDLFGVSAGEVLADPHALFSRHGPEYAATFRERLLAASRALTMWDVEAVIDTPDGQRKYTHAIARPERQPDGSVLWNGIILDNTRIKKAEMAAAASEARTREAIIESISEGICLYDQDERLITCNSRFLEMFPDARSAAAAGTPYADVARAELAQTVEPGEIEARLRERLEMHRLSSFTIEQRTRSGRSLLVSQRRAPDGSTVILFTDITELKRKEEERSQLQEQFYRAQKMQAVGRLAGGIAHDFNNILAAILGNAHFLIEDLPSDAEQHEFAQHIFAAAERAKHLVQQILAFSRQQNSEQDLVDPDALVGEAVQLLRATLPKTIELDVRTAAAGLAVRGNQTQLVQVLMNLCVNARDAIGEAQGSIHIDMAPLDGAASLPKLPAVERPIRMDDGSTEVLVGTFDGAARYLRITVRDTGCGIEHAVMERMFEPFYTTKDIGRGTGLGLSAVHGIIADHKGALHVTSKLGEGTSFELFFPIAGAPKDAAAAKSATLPTGSERVLVVDDEPQITRTTTKLLERLGYKPLAFNNPLEALAEFERAPEAWDLVVTDQTMPRLTGTELAQRLLACKAGVPIILCSGFSEGLNETSVKALGLHAFLPKPVDQGDLARTVRSALDRKTPT